MKNSKNPFFSRVKEPILLVGPGLQGEAYIKALLSVGILPAQILIHGRSRNGALALGNKYNIRFTWGATPSLGNVPVGSVAIVAASHTELSGIVLSLLELGWRNILLEKPGAMTLRDLEEIQDKTIKYTANVFIAYNRRFFSSINRAKQIIDEDGGLQSCWFDFTEQEGFFLMDNKGEKKHSDLVLSKWGLINPTHIIDLFLYFCGVPTHWTHNQYGELAWHPTGARFCGAGVTERNISFNYGSNWEGVGRWGIEFTTKNNRLRLQPLEELTLQKKNNFLSFPVVLEQSGPSQKPGIEELMLAFLRCAYFKEIDPRLCGVTQAVTYLKVVNMIFGYK